MSFSQHSVLGFVVIACLIATALSATNPGMKVVLSDEGIDGIKNTLLPYIYDLAQHMHIGDINGTQDVPAIGTVTYSVTDIHFPKVYIGKSKVYCDPGAQAMDASASDIALEVAFSWEFSQKNWPHAQDRGTGMAVDKDGMATIVLSVDYNHTSHIPEMHTRSFTLGLGKLTVKLQSHSGSVVSWFEDLFADVVILMLKSTIERAAATAVPPMLDASLQNTLVVQPFQMEVFSGVGLDYSFPAKSVVTDHDIALPIAGEFYPYNKQPGTTPGEPLPLPDSSTTHEMLEVYMSEWALNSLGIAAFYGGKLTTTLTEFSVPVEQRKYFVSGYYAQVAPGIIDVYGNESSMAVVVNVESEPNTTIADDGFDVESIVRVALLGRKEQDPSYTKAFVIDCQLHLDGLISTNGEYIIGNMTAGEYSTKLVDSAVGNVDMAGLKEMVDDTLTTAISYANQVLAQGIPLPSLRGLSIQKPIIVWSASHYVLLSGDLQYIPPQ